jgi:hypothetical protein
MREVNKTLKEKEEEETENTEKGEHYINIRNKK